MPFLTLELRTTDSMGNERGGIIFCTMIPNWWLSITRAIEVMDTTDTYIGVDVISMLGAITIIYGHMAVGYAQHMNILVYHNTMQASL